MKETQTERLLRYLEEHPGASSLEITRDCLVVNVTGRISDLRAQGIRVEDRRDGRGIHRYYLVREGQLDLALT